MRISMSIILLWTVFRDGYFTVDAEGDDHTEFDSTLDRVSRQLSRGYPYQESIVDEDTDELEDLKLNIPGIPGSDYPIYGEIPQTGFNCLDQDPQTGYFADIDAECQVFHICQEGGRKDSFLCPNGTIFSQRSFVCVWWLGFDCSTAPELYQLNYEIGKEGPYTYKDPTSLIKPSGNRPMDGNLLYSSNMFSKNRNKFNGQSASRKTSLSSSTQSSSGLQRKQQSTGQNIKFNISNFQNNILTRNRFINNNNNSNFKLRNFGNLNAYQRSRLNKQDFSTNSHNFLQKSRNRQNYRNQLDDVVAIANRQYLPPTTRNENDPSGREYLPHSHDPIGKEYLPPSEQELDEGDGNTNGKYLPHMKDSVYNKNPGREYLPPMKDSVYNKNPGREYLLLMKDSVYNKNPGREYLPPMKDSVYNKNPGREYLPPMKDSVYNKNPGREYLPPMKDSVYNKNPGREYLPPMKDSVYNKNPGREYLLPMKDSVYNKNPGREYLPPMKDSVYNKNPGREYLPPMKDSVYNKNPGREYLLPMKDSVYNKNPGREYLPPMKDFVYNKNPGREYLLPMKDSVYNKNPGREYLLPMKDSVYNKNPGREYLPPMKDSVYNKNPGREYLPPMKDSVYNKNPGREYLPPMKDSVYNKNPGREYLLPMKDSVYNKNPGREYLPPSDDSSYSLDNPQNPNRQYLPPNDYPEQNAMINNPNKEYLQPNDEPEYHYNKPNNRFGDPDRKYLHSISSEDITSKIRDTVVIGGRKSFRNNNFQKHNINKPSRVYLLPAQISNDAQNDNGNFVSGINDGKKGIINLEYLPPDDEDDDPKSGGYPSELDEPDRQYLPPTSNTKQI